MFHWQRSPFGSLCIHQTPRYNPLGLVVWREAQAEGLSRALLSGMGLSLTVGPLWTASWWGLYEYGKRHPSIIFPFSGEHRSAASVAMTSSLVASSVTAIVFNPFWLFGAVRCNEGAPKQIL